MRRGATTCKDCQARLDNRYELLKSRQGELARAKTDLERKHKKQQVKFLQESIVSIQGMMSKASC